MKKVVLFLVCLIPVLNYATQTTVDVALFADEDEPRVAGYIDANGKQGWWIIKGKDVADQTEYSAEAIIEEGNYKNDRKVGEWTTYHPNGNPKTIGVYVDNRPNGKYRKFDLDGNEVESGTMINKKQVGTFETKYGNGQTKWSKTFDENGLEQGTSTMYYDTGVKQYEYTKTNGVLTGQAIRYWEDGSIREIKTYDNEGNVVSTEVVNAEPPVVTKVEEGSGGPDGSRGKILDGKTFNPSGYNKVYNEDKDLWLDGLFKNGKLWDGKLYKYDSDGILLKIEIWKNGAYHSDGHLD